MGDKPIKTEIQPTLMTINETARYLNISRSAVYQLINEQGLPKYRLGGSIRTRADEIEQWLAGQRAE